MHDVLGWRCAVCGTDVGISTPTPWRCPRATRSDRHHVLHALRRGGPPAAPSDDVEPFLRYEARTAWAASAAAQGMTAAARRALVQELDAAVADVDGVGFGPTPFARADELSDRLGFAAAGGVHVKDETHQVAGSQKARHLFTILAQLRTTELLAGTSTADRPPLAIASCGNAALAAATLGRASGWPIDVYVPTWMSDGFGRRLDRLGARIHRCERRTDDPPGDPAMHRFRDAVDDGAIPFTVQGPENALCLDGGRTIGWELAEQVERAGRPLDRVFVQVGGGAFAACLGGGLLDAGHPTRLVAVQVAGCAPFDRALREVGDDPDPGRRWAAAMRPWTDPRSLADGILDDETYDWLAVLDAVRRSGGTSVVVPEPLVAEAHAIAVEAGFDVSPTGSAGLAGLVASLADGTIGAAERVGVVMSGVAR